MRKTVALAVIVMLLCPVVLFAVQSRKTGDTAKSQAQAAKHSTQPTPKPDRHPVSGTNTPAPTPYTRPGSGGPGHGGGSDPGVIHNPGTVPNRPGTFAPHHPGTIISPQPYQRDDRHDSHYSYPSPGRAYSNPPPPRPHWGGRPDCDDHPWYGGWGWGGSWGWSLGYTCPYPRDVIVPVPYAVPGPTVYYPVPSVEVVPNVLPAPAYGDGTPPPAPESLPLLGCDIVAGDGVFLGVIDREYQSPQSIANRNSDFGNPASPSSIWNPKGQYGSPNSDYSPWNPRATHPPMLSWHGAFKGYLTTNPDVKPAITPDALSAAIQASPWR